MACFRQFSLQAITPISAGKPNIEQIIKVWSEISVNYVKVVKTPEAISEDGLTLTGKKAVIEGEITEKIEYISFSPDRALHVWQHSMPFSQFIVLPKNFKMGTPVTVSGHIAYISIELLNSRDLFSGITALLVSEY